MRVKCNFNEGGTVFKTDVRNAEYYLTDSGVFKFNIWDEDNSENFVGLEFGCKEFGILYDILKPAIKDYERLIKEERSENMCDCRVSQCYYNIDGRCAIGNYLTVPDGMVQIPVYCPRKEKDE